MTPRSLPTRTLFERPSIERLRRQAKDLLAAFRRGDADAATEVHTHYRQADSATFRLHDAQLVLARAHGFGSWSKLKAFVDGVTVARLVEAIRAGDSALVRSMIKARPELVHLDVSENDEHRALHHAVRERRPELVRVLMQHGADARKGIWPHRAATSPATLAAERGYDEIVRIIEEEEERRRGSEDSARTAPADPLADAVLDMHRRPGAAMNARAAVDAGDVSWLEARHRERGTLDDPGLVSHAVAVGRPVVLELLLRLGLDPDERGRVGGLEDIVWTWGAPLRLCAISGNLVMAGILLDHGANANTNVYAASSALYEAHRRGDEQMVALLAVHGAQLTAVAVGDLGLVEQASKLLAPSDANTESARHQTAYDLMWGAVESSSPEIIRVALAVVDWERNDPRWYGILENGLYLGPATDRRRHLEAFRLVLDRSDANVRSGRGTALLHEIAASRGGLTADDRITYATLLLDQGARLDLRDDLLESTPLGWACRWGREELVTLLLERSADPAEDDARPWARPMEWAKKAGRPDICALLEEAAARQRR